MAMEGWVNGAGRLGIDAGPEGGARFIAGPDGASGTDAGGTGGGRSENICAEAEVAISETRIPASASAGSRRPPRPDPSMPLPPGVMVMLFTENAANSSLPQRGRGRELAGNPMLPSAEAAVRHNLSLDRGINHACRTIWRDKAATCILAAQEMPQCCII